MVLLDTNTNTFTRLWRKDDVELTYETKTIKNFVYESTSLETIWFNETKPINN